MNEEREKERMKEERKEARNRITRMSLLSEAKIINLSHFVETGKVTLLKTRHWSLRYAQTHRLECFPTDLAALGSTIVKRAQVSV